MALFVSRKGKKKIESVIQPTPNKNEKFHELPRPTGHVHNYQRFTRELDYNGNKHQVPYIVVGTGGHSKLHCMQKHGNGNQIDTPFKLPDIDNVILENYCDDRYGFMRLRVTADKLQGKFYSVAAPHKLWDKATKKIDDFELDLQKHKLA